ncbi:MAG: copper amine oxidase N-terminal domain-containing protein [Caldisericaceae bacterium]
MGNSTAYVDGVPVSLDVPPQIIKGRTLVPIRFVSENFGAEKIQKRTETNKAYCYFPEVDLLPLLQT